MLPASPMRNIAWWLNVASLVNASSVFILVLVTTYYAYTTNGILKESKKTREAADKQAEAAEKTLAHLQAQIEEQSQTALATLLWSVKELRGAAAQWQTQIGQPMPRTPDFTVDLLPPEWAASLEKARRISPAVFGNLRDLQRLSREVSRAIKHYFAKEVGHRTLPEQTQIQEGPRNSGPCVRNSYWRDRPLAASRVYQRCA